MSVRVRSPHRMRTLIREASKSPTAATALTQSCFLAAAVFFCIHTRLDMFSKSNHSIPQDLFRHIQIFCLLFVFTVPLASLLILAA